MANQSFQGRRQPELPKASVLTSSAPRFEFTSELHHPQLRTESKIFAEFSSAGWELVSVTESANFDRRYYFKRQL